MKEKLRESIKDYRFWAVAICAVMIAVFLPFNFTNMSIPTPADYGAASCAFIYLAIALPIIVIAIVAGIKLKKSRTLLLVCGLLTLSLIIRLLFANDVSGDYDFFLSAWVDEYRFMSIKECFIKQVGNYPPLYNYFLIAFSRMDISDMYLIKILSYCGEIVTAIFAVKIIAYVRKQSFDFVIFAIFLILPVPIINGIQWAQCDTLYTMCAVAGVYFALRSKSIPCFIFIGLGLAFKMQMLFILPAGLVILLAKKPEGGKYLLWRFIWIVPLVFLFASSLPVCFGGSFFKVFKVYFEQATVGNTYLGQVLNGHCANILLPFSQVGNGSALYYICLVLFILITAVVEIFIIVHTLKSTNRVLDTEKLVFLCFTLPFVSVFFMPKMLDRFFYIAEIFGSIYFFIKRDKISFTSSVLLETGQVLVYLQTVCYKYIGGIIVITPLFTGFALILIAARFFKYFPCKKPKFLPVWVDAIEYGKVIKPASEETQEQHDEPANESTDGQPAQQNENQ